MKIATFNVNGVNARLPVLLRWLAKSRPDVACLQELKAPQERFPRDAIREAGYRAIWHGQKAWNGVAILARTTSRRRPGAGCPGPGGRAEPVHRGDDRRGASRVPVPAQRQPGARPAGEVGLDPVAFRAALDGRQYRDAHRAALRHATELGITGVPAFEVDGRLLVGVQPRETLEEAVAAAASEPGGRPVT